MPFQRGVAASVVSVFQFPQNMPSEMILDFGMARDGLTGMSSRILIPVVTSAMSNEQASHRLDFSQKFFTFHAS
jgi:hypothetical protein